MFDFAIACGYLVTFVSVGLRAATDDDVQEVERILTEVPVLKTNPSEITNVERLNPEDLRKNSNSFKKLILGPHKDLHDTINDYLVKKLPDNENVDDNLEVIADWAELETNKPLDDIDDGLQLALHKLADLRGIYGMSKYSDGEKCSHEEYVKLAKNDLLTKGRAHVPVLSSDFSRIDYVVHIVMNNHAIECYPIYLDRFVKLIGDFDKKSLAQIDQFSYVVKTSALMKIVSGEQYMDVDLNLTDPNKIIDMIGSIGDKQLARDIHRMIEFFSVTYPTVKSLNKSIEWPKYEDTIATREAKMDRLIGLHLVKPCLDYTSFFGPELYEPFEFDNVILDKRPDLDTPLDRKEVDFFENYKRYTLCYRFMNGNLVELRNAILRELFKDSESLWSENQKDGETRSD